MADTDEIKEYNDRLLSLGPRDHTEFPFQDIPAPPNDDAKCKLTLIQTGRLATVPEAVFLKGATEDSIISCPAYAFLIEKTVEGKKVRVIYEMGFRGKASPYTHPRYVKMGKQWKVEPNAGVPEILKANGIPLDSISSFILGHAHWDHIGNLADLPRSVDMLVGPDSPMGEDLATDMDVPIEEIHSRTVRQLSRTADQWEQVGTFRGFDYFGDGSFWILDVPGHKPGHVGGLVRTSTHPPVYHVLGSDTAHDVHLINSPERLRTKAGIFPGSLLGYNVGGRLLSMHADLAEAYVSMAKMGRMDEEANVNVCLAHDPTMDSVLAPGDFVLLEGSLEELQRLKNRNKSRIRYKL